MANIEIYGKDDYRILKGYTIGSYEEEDNYIEDGPNAKAEVREYIFNEVLFELRLCFTGLTAGDMETYYTPEDEEEEDFIYKWEDACDSLLEECGIDADLYRHTPQGSEYDLEGNANNLIKFMERFNDHFGPEGFADDGTEGEALYEEKREFLNYLEALCNGQGREFSCDHIIKILHQDDYGCAFDYRIEDYDSDIYPDPDDAGFFSLEALKNWFINEWAYFKVYITIPNGGFDYDDVEHYHDSTEEEPLTEEEKEQLYEWSEWVENLAEQHNVETDYEDWTSIGSIYEVCGTPANIFNFCQDFKAFTLEGYPEEYPLRECIPEIQKWINEFFPLKRLGFFDESLEDGNLTIEDIEELENILENNDDENACKLLFNRDKKHVYTANAYVMLLEQFNGNSWTKERILNNYRHAGIEIFPSFEKYFIEANEDELEKVAEELQRLNIRDYKWGILYGSGEEDPLSLKRALYDCGAANAADLWKSVKDQMAYIEAKGWITRQKKLGFFDV